MFAGVKSGVRMGGRLAGWVLLFLGCEALADWGWNSRKDFRSAALTGGIFGVAGSRVCEWLFLFLCCFLLFSFILFAVGNADLMLVVVMGRWVVETSYGTDDPFGS